jgi:hypothetical protein
VAVYPTIVQRPFTRVLRFFTSKIDLENGLRYAYPLRTVPIASWQISYSALNDTEIATLGSFFLANGRYGTFTFTDPEDASVHPSCRFGMDDLVIRHLGPRQNAAEVTIEEFS